MKLLFSLCLSLLGCLVYANQAKIEDEDLSAFFDDLKDLEFENAVEFKHPRSNSKSKTMLAPGSDTRFTYENRKLLKYTGAYNKNLRHHRRIGTNQIKWTQTSRCWWSSCRENYTLHEYKDQYGNSYIIFINDANYNSYSPPSSVSTNGYRGQLHFGFIYNKGTAINGQELGSVFFVIHPNSWGPFQRRFATSSYTSWFNAAASGGAGKVLDYVGGAAGALAGGALAATTAGAAAGSVIPGLGTAVGAVVGFTFATLGAQAFDALAGDYLRYIG